MVGERGLSNCAIASKKTIIKSYAMLPEYLCIIDDEQNMKYYSCSKT